MLFTIFIIAFALLASSSLATDSLASGINHAPRIAVGSSASTNWGGYALTGAPGTFNDVKGSWIVPAVTCSGGNQYSSYWVGIDGYDSKTVEQVGTSSDCVGSTPRYYAWYQLYPHNSQTLMLTIHPGDVISARMQYERKNTFTVYLTDVTTGQSVMASDVLTKAARASAEWIFEASSSNGVQSLANFGSVSFGQTYTGVSDTNFAFVNRLFTPIGNTPGVSVHSITLVTSGGVTKATPSALTPDGSSFTGTWQHS
jgi:hypothetical protein